MSHFVGMSMKNFSIIATRLVIVASFSVLAVGVARADPCAFLPSAPSHHVVLKHDTLWDISGQFLEHPWCWAQVWGMNREDIRDPHWIYPGQIVYLDRAAGRLRLAPSGSGNAAPGSTVQFAPAAMPLMPLMPLMPQIRLDGMDKDAVPSISPSAIEPFLSQSLVIEPEQTDAVPRIVAGQENHVYLGKNDKAYVRGALNGLTSFQVLRPGKVLRDPVSGAVLGHEAFYLGLVQLQVPARPGSDVHTFVVASSKQEMGVGDRLVPAPAMAVLNFAPHPPPQPVDARVMSVHGGLTYAGQNQVVSLNRGAQDGLDHGTVLQLRRDGRTVDDPDVRPGRGQLKLPDERYGDLIVFRVFKHVAYALIMQVTEPVEVGDIALSPQ
jgi:hypothetical protein